MVLSLFAALVMLIIGIESLYHNAVILHEIDPEIELAASTAFIYNSVQKVKHFTR